VDGLPKSTSLVEEWRNNQDLESAFAPKIVKARPSNVVCWSPPVAEAWEETCTETLPPRFTPWTTMSRESRFQMSKWHRTMCEHSGLDLTFHKDKLPAISGLARQFPASDLGTYMAGLWSFDFSHDLLWYPGYSKIPCPRPTGTGYPSWSWASISNEIYWSDKPDPSAESMQKYILSAQTCTGR